MKEYRVVEYYGAFFAIIGYKLQVKEHFLFFKWWVTVEEDPLGLHAYEWSQYYKCPIIGE